MHTLKWFGSIYLQSVHTAEDNIYSMHIQQVLSFYKVEGGGADSSLIILKII